MGYSTVGLDNLGNVAPKVSDGHGLEGSVDKWYSSADVPGMVKYLQQDLGFEVSGLSSLPSSISQAPMRFTSQETKLSNWAGDYVCGYTYAQSLKHAELTAARATENSLGSNPAEPIPVVFCHVSIRFIYRNKPNYLDNDTFHATKMNPPTPLPGQSSDPAQGDVGPYSEAELVEFVKGVGWFLGMEVMGRM